ncbi:MAG: phosphate regulon sensor histidine kinase PhoR [Pseudomonadota bacterium]
MISRFLVFGAFLFAGAITAWYVAGIQWLAAGALVGAVLWMAWDTFSMSRLLRWLAAEQQSDTPGADSGPKPPRAGAWGEIADRMNRIVRKLIRMRQRSENRLDDFLSAMQASPNGVVLLDAEGRIEWCNQTAAHHFGFDVQRDLLQYAANLIREPSFARYLAGGDFSQEVSVHGRDSTAARPVKLSLRLHAYGENRKLLLSRDVTAVQQADAMRRDFVANVSHEIRTPLTVLSGFVETLQTLTLDDRERHHYLALMAQQAARMQTLVSDLLTLSRLEGSPPPRHQEWQSVQALFDQCAAEARALQGLLTPTEEHTLGFSVESDCELAGEASELFSAMSNLVTNALRYTPSPGAVQVTWRQLDDGRGEFAVKDTGPGIAAEHIPRLTERFYRVDRSRSRESGGTGLGLAIVKHVAQRHGGELHIDSRPGAGSRFSIIFPSGRVRPVQLAETAG